MRPLTKLSVLLLLTLLFTALDAPRALAVPLPPIPAEPPNGGRTADYEVILQWGYPSSGITQVQLQVTPYNNDGAAIDLIRNANCCATDSFRIPPPPEWYGLLPDMTYSWRLRASESTEPIDGSSTSWGPWSPVLSFKTPLTSATSVQPVEPFSGATVTETPTLRWRSLDPALFYFEFQLSADETFNTNPATATAAVYWNLIHGALTNPPNSYTVPSSSPLQRGKTYFWRVRPRIQGNGTPLAWTTPWQVRVP
jgi:hypothetical protein